MLQNQNDVNALFLRSKKYIEWKKIINDLGIKDKNKMSKMEIQMLNNFVINTFEKVDTTSIIFEDEEHEFFCKFAQFLSDIIYGKNQ